MAIPKQLKKTTQLTQIFTGKIVVNKTEKNEFINIIKNQTHEII